MAKNRQLKTKSELKFQRDVQEQKNVTKCLAKLMFGSIACSLRRVATLRHGHMARRTASLLHLMH